MKKRKQSSTRPKKVIISKSRRIAVLVAVIILAAASLVILSASTARWIASAQTEQRKERIEQVYTNLSLPDSYKVTGKNIFGEKRVYEWDSSRTYASSMTYLRGAPVDETVAELDSHIKNAGFTYVDEPYPGSVATQYHYRSKDGVFIRLTVSSKVYDDALQNAFVLDETKLADISSKVDINAAPSNVLIKVNLDDNNE